MLAFQGAFHKFKVMAIKFLVLSLLFSVLAMTDAESVGVCYGKLGGGLPSERDVVTLYRNNGITKMRIYEPDQAILRALKGTNIELILDVPKDNLQSLNDQGNANTWVRDNIQRYPDVKFKYIAVGNEVDPNNDNRRYVNFVLPAMRNIHNALRAAGLDNKIKVSTATYTGLLGKSYPPSDGEFDNNVRGFIEPIIRFLAQNNLPMLANIYPYFGYLGDPNSNLQYALFTAQGTVVNDVNGRQYSNLFSAMLDAHYAAQARLGGENVKIVVSESGWPSAGGRAATIENAGTYYRNLIAHVKGRKGTPQKPGRCIETYLFAMFDENNKQGAETEKHFGVFSPNQQPKYQLKF
ncbi:Glycoside hydrolase, catalytic domain-containing protein [Artemisia annua]|uniref:Glycoside hydrolase, catalytic domain-containing protein n=1 Tax=Artemisia annua TaxID=35608 RepID=A0A2U1PNH0_ARTAN|nr:Glycoside hydrolase, catalytic domain-containing protein [Artemisia annua]